MEHRHHSIVRLDRKYRLTAEFVDVDGRPTLAFDEPEPLGDGQAPNAAAVLGAAIGNCLAASLAFCLRKVRLEPVELTADVVTRVERNAEGRLRITGIDVRLTPVLPDAADADDRFKRCERLFEDFCTLTASVRQGIPVRTEVERHTAATSGR